MKNLEIDFDSCQRSLLIDSSKTILKAVLLHNGYKPLVLAVNMKKRTWKYEAFT